jgi:conjugal transfer pilus assembly protein TraE
MKFWSYWDKLTAENKLLKNVFLILAVTIVILVYAIMKISSIQRVVVLPPKVDREFWVSGNEVSTSYLEMVGYYIADRVMNVSPGNADSSYDYILPFLSTDPDIVKTIRTTLKTQAEAIIKDDIYQSFYPRDVNIDQEKKCFTVSGTVRRGTGNIYIGSGTGSVNICYTINYGKFTITKLEVNDGI